MCPQARVGAQNLDPTPPLPCGVCVLEQGELRAEAEKSSKERKEGAERVREMESAVEWAKAEKDEAVLKLNAEKRSLQEKLRESEAQLNQLKARKRDELKVPPSLPALPHLTSLPVHRRWDGRAWP